MAALTLTVEIVCRENIKPSCPTPPSLRNYELSGMDQVGPSVYVPYVLFYSKATNSISLPENSLKKALSETLTHMYPLAGRIKVDHMSINCNDHGADYIETRVNDDMSKVINSPKTNLLLQLLPLNPYTAWRTTSDHTADQVLIAVQVNYFGCGGVAISACIRHEIADASTAASFLQIWASLARGDDGNASEYDGFVFPKRTDIFPPFSNLNGFRFEDHSGEPQVNKLLVFDGLKVSSLKERVGVTEGSIPITRFEAVTGFLWATMISVARKRNPDLEVHSMATVVNLRNKLNPPLPAHTMGNIIHNTMALWEAWEMKLDHRELVNKLRESVKKVTEDYIRQVHRDEDFINILKSGRDYIAVSSEYELSAISSWLRFPFYEIDFGWGKPVWFASLVTANNIGYLLDTRKGDGVEVWLRLRKEDMEKLELDPDFLACVSAIHTL